MLPNRRTALAKLFGRARRETLQLQVNALIVWGERDPFLHSELAGWLAGLLPAARTVRLANAGHFPHQDCPDAVARSIVELLDSLGD